jgi:Legume lectin domain
VQHATRKRTFQVVACVALAILASACDRISSIDVLVPKDTAVALDSEAPVVDAGCGAACVVDAPSACIETASYPGGGVYQADFTDVSQMTVNMGASALDNFMRLVSVTGIEEGSAYFTTPVGFDGETSIYAHFATRIGGGAGNTGTDGMAFVLQSDPRGPTAIGVAGGGMGYKTVTPSVVIEFDTFFNPASDPDGNHVALMANGDDLQHLASSTAKFDLNDGVVRNVWVDYDATLKLLEVYVSDAPTRPANPMLVHSGFDFGANLGGEVYVGFSAASGSMKNNHDVLGEAWFVTSKLPKCR